jgi:hypothetical protein
MNSLRLKQQEKGFQIMWLHTLVYVFSFFHFSFIFFEIGSCYVPEVGLELAMLSRLDSKL